MSKTTEKGRASVAPRLLVSRLIAARDTYAIGYTNPGNPVFMVPLPLLL
ncbi:MAG: hypothetical protein AAGG72_03850 [Pseudomonadota bacterium]